MSMLCSMSRRLNQLKIVSEKFASKVFILRDYLELVTQTRERHALQRRDGGVFF